LIAETGLFAEAGWLAEAGLAARSPAFNASQPARQTAIFPRHFMVSIYRLKHRWQTEVASHGVELSLLGTTTNSLSPLGRGAGRGEGI
jgi:hypothetical protein